MKFRLWQQEMVLERMKNAKPEDYIDADDGFEKDLKNEIWYLKL